MSKSQVLAAVPRAFTPFDSGEIAQLQVYHELVDDLDAYELAKPQKFEFEIDVDGSLERGPDRQQLEALFTAFRKIGWLNDDATFARVRNLLGEHAHAAGTSEGAKLLDVLKGLRKLRAASLAAGPIGYTLERADGTNEEVPPKDVIDMLINGVIFHSDASLRAKWTELGGWTNPTVMMIAITAIHELLRLFRALDQIVVEVLSTPGLYAS